MTVTSLSGRLGDLPRRCECLRVETAGRLGERGSWSKPDWLETHLAWNHWGHICSALAKNWRTRAQPGLLEPRSVLTGHTGEWSGRLLMYFCQRLGFSSNTPEGNLAMLLWLGRASPLSLLSYSVHKSISMAFS